MNIVALSNRLASKVPHWYELEKLSKEDKIEVIALLSMSMANAEVMPKKRVRSVFYMKLGIGVCTACNVS